MPITIPPTMLIPVIIRPAVASPFTYFVAPSIEPKKLFLRSESIAICLPAMASSVNRAVTSATRSVPLLITIN